MAGRAASCHHLHLATRIISARLTSSTPARSATWVLPDQRVSASDSRLIDDACNCRRVVIIIAFDAGPVSPQAPRRYIRLPRRPAKQFRSSPCAQCVTGSAEWVRDEVFLNPSIGRSRSLAQALPDAGGIIQNKGEVERWYTVRETAILCHRPEGTSRNLLSRDALPRRLVRVPAGIRDGSSSFLPRPCGT